MPSPAEIEDAARALREGRLVAFPTETVYGLGADATNGHAVAEVYAAKGRPAFNPLIVHVASATQAFDLGQFPDAARRLALAGWPGPLSIVVPRAPDCPVSLLASAGLDSIALRVPAHPVALALLQATARPVVAPSANPSGRVSPTSADHVRRHLGGKVAMILDGGRCRVGVESSVVSFLDDGPKLLRPGGMPRAEIEAIIGMPLAVEAHSAAAACAGPAVEPLRAARRTPPQCRGTACRRGLSGLRAPARAWPLQRSRPGAISSRLPQHSSGCCTRSTPRVSRASPWPPSRITALARPSTTGCCARRLHGVHHEAQRCNARPSRRRGRRSACASRCACHGRLHARVARNLAWRFAPGAASGLDPRSLANSRHRQRDAHRHRAAVRQHRAQRRPDPARQRG